MSEQSKDSVQSHNFQQIKSFEIEDKIDIKPLLSIYTEGQFKHAIQFWLSCLGSAVGYGNIWRFPYVLYSNGGGVFLIPYFTGVVILVFPLYYLEVAYGQLYRRPLHKYYSSIKEKFVGLSYAVAIVGFFTSIFLTTLLAWGINFLLFSFQNPLPWAGDHGKKVHQLWKEGYFREELLQTSTGLGDMNKIVVWLAISFVIAAVINYLTIFKSLKSVGVVVYVIIPLPYIFLTFLFLKGLTLEGFYEGWLFLFKPDWDQLFTFKIWKDAGAQVIFSFTLGINTMILFAGNRDRNERILPAAIGIPIMNFFTSIFASMTLFSFLGYASYQTGISISDMPIEGIELAYVVYPSLIATLPWANFWAILFFIMLIGLGLSSQFPYYEVCITFLHGMLKKTKYRTMSKDTLYLIFCSVILFIDILLLASDAGFYWFTLFDHFTAGLNLLIILFFQTIILGWYLDVDRLETKVKQNKEWMPRIYKFSIKYISPLYLFCLIGLGVLSEFAQPLQNTPWWGTAIGLCILTLPFIFIVTGMFVKWNEDEGEDSDISIVGF